MKILQVCAYAAPYEGNFIKSLFALEAYLKNLNYETIYAFPESAKQRSWCRELAKTRTVYYLPLKKARIKPETYRKLKTIFRTHTDINIVHSHFELYDLPLALTTPDHVRLFGHLHDALMPCKKISRRILEVMQYKIFSSKATLLSVAEQYCEDLVRMGFPKQQAYTIVNGIDIDRIQKKTDINDEEYDFLAFVWNSYIKGLDILLDACRRLSKDGINFKILLIGNEATQKQIDTFFPDGTNEIILQGASSDVNKLYRNAKVFVSSSRVETFSYAVCESAFAGLPVISSKITGLEWAENLPSVEFFENENSVMLYEKMKSFLLESQISQSQIEVAQEFIAKHYSTDCWVKNICNLYGI